MTAVLVEKGYGFSANAACDYMRLYICVFVYMQVLRVLKDVKQMAHWAACALSRWSAESTLRLKARIIVPWQSRGIRREKQPTASAAKANAKSLIHRGRTAMFCAC